MARRIGPEHVAIAAAVGAALFVAYHATRAAGPVPSPATGPFTELEAPAQNLVEHLAHAAELFTEPVRLPHRYPAQTCPGITSTIHGGFAVHYQLPDPQLAAAPAEKAW